MPNDIFICIYREVPELPGDLMQLVICELMRPAIMANWDKWQAWLKTQVIAVSDGIYPQSQSPAEVTK